MEKQRAALVAIYNATDGPNWTENSNWLSDAPLDQWAGVTTNDAGSVIKLELWTNNLRGELPAELADLVKLEELDVSDNQLSDCLPFAMRRNFRNLNLSGTQFCPSPDRAALVAIYEATNGRKWRDRTNWLKEDVPISEWYGVRTDENGYVIRLALSGNDLSGAIPVELGNLSNLQFLSISNRRLRGEIPAELGNLANLQSLILGSRSLIGGIPAELGNLASLQSLSLSGTRLSGEIPAELGNLANLQSLDLSGTQLSGEIPAELGNLANLQSLDLSDNQLSGEIPAELGNLASLPRISLARNQLIGCVPGRLIPIDSETPFCSEAPVSARDSEKERRALVALYKATDGPNWKDPCNIPDCVRYNRSNEWLREDLPIDEWYGVNVDENGYVIGLLLSKMGFSGEIPPELGGLTYLRTLNLSYSQLSGEMPAELGNLSSLQSLHLSSNQLRGEIPAELGNLSHLQSLNLSRNELSGEIPAELGNMSHLQSLGLSSNQLSGEIPAELGNMSSLQSLTLSSNRLTGEIPAELGNLASLQSLHLYSNQLTGEIPAELGNLASLRVLGLFSETFSDRYSSNRFSGCVPRNLESQLSRFHRNGRQYAIFERGLFCSS